LVILDLGDLKKEKHALAEFLQSKLQMPVKIKGNILVLGDEESKTRKNDVKVYIKTYLHQRGYSKMYRVTVNRQQVRLTKTDLQKRRKAPKEGLTPHPADTMPWYYPWRT
jgi:hypothetical protein